MRSLDDPPRSAADLRRLRQVSALFDHAELISQCPEGAERDEAARCFIREATQLSVENRISREERDRIVEILSCVTPADAAAH
jgi:hypothetical protein